jgi:hypothetical protein
MIVHDELPKLYTGANGLEFLDENAASDSLRNAQKPKAPLNQQARALELMMQLASLPANKAKEHLDDLEKSLCTHDSGDGVLDGTAEKSRASLNSAQKKTPMPTLKNKKSNEELEAFMAEHFGPDFCEQARDLFERAVSSKSASDALQKTFASDPIFELMFADDATIDRVTEMANRVDELQAACEAIEALNAELMSESTVMIDEELLFLSPQQRSRPTQRRSLDLDELVDEDNRILMGEDRQMSKIMAARLEHLERTTAHTDIHPLNENIVAAWKVNNN